MPVVTSDALLWPLSLRPRGSPPSRDLSKTGRRPGSHTGTSGVAPIRGFTAPASLKPRWLWRPAPCLMAYPGLHRSGLIEAAASPSAWEHCSTAYPGLHRPGLIEASSRPRSQVGHGSPIRGFTAPASLKLIQVNDQQWLNAGAYPGLHRPGLIEARSLRAQKACGDLVLCAEPAKNHRPRRPPTKHGPLDRGA